jgi:hypothetical protein
MSYAVDSADIYHKAASYVDKILKGANPADLPFEQSMKFDLVINLKTAKSLGLTIPPTLLAESTGAMTLTPAFFGGSTSGALHAPGERRLDGTPGRCHFPILRP